MSYYWRSKVTLYAPPIPLEDKKKFSQSCSDISVGWNLSMLKQHKEPKSDPILKSYRNDSYRLMNQSMNTMMKGYLNSEEYKNFEEYYVAGTSSKKFVSIKMVYQMFEKILSHYKIDVYSVWNEMSDSAIQVTPVKINTEMYFYSGILLKELKDFPYTLYRALNCRIFTFCGEMKIMNISHQQIFIKKYYNWNFIVDEHKTPEQIRKHLYNTICYHLVNSFPGLNEKWEKLNPKSPKGRPRIVLKIGEIKAGYLNTRCYKNSMMDQFEVFDALMQDPEKVLHHRDPIVAKKARVLVRALMLLDPEGIDQDWWVKKGLIPENEKDYIFLGL